MEGRKEGQGVEKRGGVVKSIRKLKVKSISTNLKCLIFRGGLEVSFPVSGV